MSDLPGRETYLIDYWRVLVKRRWVVWTSLLVIVSVVTIGSLLQRKLYRATVRLQIERSAPNVLPFQQISGIPDEFNDFYQTQYGLIQSRRVAREVISSLHLDQHADFASGPAPSAGEDAGAMSKRLDRFLALLKVAPVPNSRLVDVSFTSGDPDLSARVANRVAETYMVFNSQAQYNTSERATSSLAIQIANLQEEIDEKEKKLQGYARDHGIIPLNEKQSILLKNLNDLSDAYSQAQSARIEKEARYAALREARAEAIPEVMQSALLRDLVSKSAELAARRAQLSEKFKPDWPEMVRLRREEEETNNRLAEESASMREQVIASAATAYQAARNQETSLGDSLETMKRRAQEMGLEEIEYNNLKLEVANRRATLEALVKRQSEASTSTGLYDVASSNVRIVDPAEPPLFPSSPKIMSNVFIATLFGVGLGICLAFLFEHFDRSVKSVEDLEAASGAPCIGMIPSLPQRGGKLRLVWPGTDDVGEGPAVDVISQEDPSSKIAEAFRGLRTSILVSRPGGPPWSILMTSAHPGEGKTTVALNLAVTLAQIGKRVLLVDADSRRSRLHRALGLECDGGLSNDLSETGPIRLRSHPTGIPGLDLLPSGPMPPNPADLLDSERLQQLLREFAARGYDHVVFDSPPVLAVADAAILAGRVDVVAVVVHAGRTDRDALKHAAMRLRQVKAHLVGCVLNRVNDEEHGYYAGYYGPSAPAETEPESSEMRTAARSRRIQS